jgi:hypothetical protein
MNHLIELGHDYNRLGSIERPNYVLTQRIFDNLRDAHYLSGSYKGLTDLFSEIATESLTMTYLLDRYQESSLLKMGHIAHSTDEQIFYFVKPSGVGISHIQLSLIISNLTSSALTNSAMIINIKDIYTWSNTNIKNNK